MDEHHENPSPKKDFPKSSLLKEITIYFPITLSHQGYFTTDTNNLKSWKDSLSPKTFDQLLLTTDNNFDDLSLASIISLLPDPHRPDIDWLYSTTGRERKKQLKKLFTALYEKIYPLYPRPSNQELEGFLKHPGVATSISALRKLFFIKLLDDQLSSLKLTEDSSLLLSPTSDIWNKMQLYVDFYYDFSKKPIPLAKFIDLSDREIVNQLAFGGITFPTTVIHKSNSFEIYFNDVLLTMIPVALD